MTHGREKSDPSIVAVKLANKTGQTEAEPVERREGAEGNTEGQHTRRTQSRESVSQGLDRVRKAAQQKKKERFTALLHYVTGFQHKGEAERFMADMRQRLEKFALSLHPEKTRLIEFGRFAAKDRENRRLGKPGTFNFLGFTHICSRSRGGAFQLKRH